LYKVRAYYSLRPRVHLGFVRGNIATMKEKA
jgi:hypothetical protein